MSDRVTWIQNLHYNSQLSETKQQSGNTPTKQQPGNIPTKQQPESTHTKQQPGRTRTKQQNYKTYIIHTYDVLIILKSEH